MKLFGLVNRATGIRRRAMLSAVAAGATGLALGLAPAQAHAAESTATGIYQNKQTGFCLDGNAYGDVYTSVCDKNNPWQQWRFTYTGLNADTIIHVKTGNCLTNPYGSNSVITARVVCSRWKKDGDYRRLAAYPSKCLDSNWQKQVYLQSCNGGGYQRWQLIVISRTG